MYQIEYFNPYYQCEYFDSPEAMQAGYARIVSMPYITGIYVNAPTQTVLNH